MEDVFETIFTSINYPFSIIGYFIFFGYCALILYVIAVPLWFLLKNFKWKIWIIAPITLFLIAVPVIEEIRIHSNFEELCQDAGVHVKRKVIADGYLDATGSGPINTGNIQNKKAIDLYEKSGFRFKEYTVGYRLPGNKYSRVEKQENGKWLLTIHDKPMSRYHLLHTHNHSKVGHQLTKHQRVIMDMQKNEVIGRDTSYSRYPGWIDGLWIQFFGKGQTICSGPISEPEKHKRIGQITKYVLIPSLNVQK
ncbi:MAG: hypothetical protein OQK95_14875 [Gammaproteobacteria bacterium]|nr:hypothetical protein [Gammaproteobacteria bacterium]